MTAEMMILAVSHDCNLVVWWTMYECNDINGVHFWHTLSGFIFPHHFYNSLRAFAYIVQSTLQVTAAGGYTLLPQQFKGTLPHCLLRKGPTECNSRSH